MIVIDFSQSLYAAILAYDHKTPDKIDMNIFRHICLSMIHGILSKFKFNYGNEVIIACDGKNNWRKSIFQYYKYNRRKSRNESSIDWSKVYEKFDQMKSELKEYFTQYKVLEFDNAEADDIVYCTAKYCYDNNKPLLIISSDKDLVQLQKYKNIKQYDGIKKTFKEVDDPIKFLDYQIFKGDNSDGIPNVLSPSNTYYMGVRSKPLYEKKIEEWMNDPMFNFNPEQVLGKEIYERYELNKKLIDLTCIPRELFDNIITEISKDFDTRDSNKLLNYFCENKLSVLIKNLQDF